jgi:hypothetical protein
MTDSHYNHQTVLVLVLAFAFAILLSNQRPPLLLTALDTSSNIQDNSSRVTADLVLARNVYSEDITALKLEVEY